ncbi:MAG TPA: TIGR04063 family PEP-CTERM/XrtA system glycosyltransferase [Planctomycetota bacterium]|nr:TIGR04063 family PEP-CTERM/XrtA system glycosyltransferase [Planctomycetota bacterium]
MRILHVLDHSLPLHSGYTFRTRSILREQRRLGWETAHLTSPKHAAAAPESASVERETVDGLEFHRTPPARGVLAKLPGVSEWALMGATERRLEALVRELKPDVIHAHSPVLNGLPAIRVGRRLGVATVYEVRAFWEDAAVDIGHTHEGSLRYRATRALETRALRRVDHATCICEGLRSDIVARGIPAEKVTVIPNAVDLEHFEPARPADPELLRKLGLAGRRVLGFIGSFYAYEGLSLLLDAMPEILSRLQRDEHKAKPEVGLLLVGGGKEEERLKGKAASLGLYNDVVFAGRVPHSDVRRYYDLVDVLCYPRLPMRLTDLVTPLKPLEAMAQRRLIVASDVGGHRELIHHGETGMLFKAGDPRALAEAVVGLLKAPDTWEALRDAGRRYVETERNWPNSVARYRDVYAKALAARRGAG